MKYVLIFIFILSGFSINGQNLIKGRLVTTDVSFLS